VADPQNDQNGLKKYLPGGERPMAPQARRRMITFAVIAFVLGILVINSLFLVKTSRPSRTPRSFVTPSPKR
jgi:hypothetical protein